MVLGGYVMKIRLRFLLLCVTAFCNISLLSAQAQKRIVAVATFDNKGGVTKDESEYITDQFIARLIDTGTLTVVDRKNVDKIIAEHHFQMSDWSNPQKTALLGGALNVEFIIHGTITKIEGDISFTSSMLNIQTMEELASAWTDDTTIRNLARNRLSAVVRELVSSIPPLAIPSAYFIGRWRSSSGSSVCVLNFLPNGTINIEQFVIVQSVRKLKGLKYVYANETYTCYGSGSYFVSGNKISINLDFVNAPEGITNINVTSAVTINHETNFTLSTKLGSYNSFLKIQ
jgi:TolB-like protein